MDAFDWELDSMRNAEWGFATEEGDYGDKGEDWRGIL